MEFIRSMMLAMRRMFDVGSQRSALDPSELVNALTKEAMANAKAWEDLTELPNSFEVCVSEADWDEYYGFRVRQNEERLTHALCKFVEEIHAQMEPPVVTLMTEEGIRRGDVRIYASFAAEPIIDVETLRFDDASQTDLGDHASPWSTTPPFSWDDDVQASTSRITSETPVFVADAVASASIAVPNGPRFDVLDGSTMGIRRDSARQLPTIELPYAPSVGVCSQVQGRFTHKGGQWYLTNCGRNAMRIRRDGKWVEVEDSTALVDDDKIFVGPSKDPAVVFHCEVA